MRFTTFAAFSACMLLGACDWQAGQANNAQGNISEDARTGQNAVAQARSFTEALPVTGIVLTKMDGTARGGVIVTVKDELGIPIKFVGTGEKPEDFAPFDPRTFTEALFAD